MDDNDNCIQVGGGFIHKPPFKKVPGKINTTFQKDGKDYCLGILVPYIDDKKTPIGLVPCDSNLAFQNTWYGSDKLVYLKESYHKKRYCVRAEKGNTDKNNMTWQFSDCKWSQTQMVKKNIGGKFIQVLSKGTKAWEAYQTLYDENPVVG
jgi:hypothetical protein